MQLILCTDIDIGIHNKMSSINDESLNEKNTEANFTEESVTEIENGNKENIERKVNIITDCDEKESSESICDIVEENSSDDKNIIKLSDENDMVEEDKINDNKCPNSNEDVFVDIVVIHPKTDALIIDEESDHIVENGIEAEITKEEDKVINIPSEEENYQEQTDLNRVELTDSIDQTRETQSLNNSCASNEEDVKETVNTDSCNEKLDNSVIIDIADEIPVDTNINDENEGKASENVIIIDKIISDATLKINDEINIIDEGNCSNEKDDDDASNILENNIIQSGSIIESNDNNNKADIENRPVEIKAKKAERRKLSLLSNLSNTLDILSDDDDDNCDDNPKHNLPELNDPPVDVSQSEVGNSTEKQCINIEDDDDIMVIDDEATLKESEPLRNDNVEPSVETKMDEDIVEDNKVDFDMKADSLESIPSNDTSETIAVESKEPEGNEVQEDLKKEEKFEPKKPLLPVTFLKTCKKNLADMSRAELEEFCIIKIVESVVDRSNLGDIKAQLKCMAQNIEEYKNITEMLNKQNRELKVILKSVQEEQKKNIGVITPLKITRSVGIQVLMSEKILSMRPIGFNSTTANNQPIPNLISRPIKAQPQNNTPSKNPKTPNNQQIPVPRLVPAVNINNNKNNANNSQQNANNSTKIQTNNNVPNGLKNPASTLKPQKRSHGRMQQNNSFTVDLTDDEPPTKFLHRNTNTPVRCVPPQNLLAPRQPLPQAINSPRKVYIPISGPQSQNVRPGQTIMLKSISPQNPRPRAPNVKMIQNAKQRINRVTYKHPAPLPDTMKQYQPPNWKALPPPPELKLSKVENGIVISWNIEGYEEDDYEEIASYQLYAYQEIITSPPSTSFWKKIGDVKALPLPMACTLTQFMAGYKYYFAVRAVDIRSRYGPYSLPGNILLQDKI